MIETTRELKEWREIISGEKNERKIVDIKLVEENDFAPNRKTKIHKLKIENKRLTNELGQAKKIIRDLLEWQRIYGQASHKYQHRCDEARAFLEGADK